MEEQKRKLLVVCTGNTCRSPMAAALLSKMLEEKGLSGEYAADSAGVAAFDFQPASENAVLAAKEEGFDLSEHRARRITMEDLDGSELIFVMSQQHKDRLASVLPEAEEKLVVMDIPDPFGGDLPLYRECFAAIRSFFERYFEENPL